MGLVSIRGFWPQSTAPRPLARRLSTPLVALGIIATIVTTAAETYRDFQAEIALLEARLENVKDLYVPSLTASVWDYSEIQVKLELQGLLNTPGFEYAEVKTVEGPVWALGQKISADIIVQEFPLVHVAPGEVTDLGVLKIVAGKQAIYDRLFTHALELMLYFGAWSFFVAGSMFLIFRQLVTRHLNALASYTSSISLDIDAQPLVLDRAPHKDSAGDELDQVANSINTLRTQLAGTIHELQKNQEFLRKALADSEKASNAKSDFLASMSHELRTPLNAVLGFAQILQFDQKSPLTPAQNEHVSIILEGGNHLLELVNNILDLSKIEADQLSPNLENVNAREIVSDCVALTTPLGAPKHITIDDRFSAKALAEIRTDRTRLKQILLNLLSNAVKYNKEGGMIIVDGQETDDDFLHISVTDTGAGIPQKDQEDIFQMFRRLGADPMKTKEGLGIGLTVTKLLVEKLGGRIGLESEAGVGSTFWIELPLTTNDTALIWDDSYRVGIDAIDKDHQVLIQLFNDLTYRTDGDGEVDRIIEELMDVTRAHLWREETIMEGSGYPYLEIHRSFHKNLISQANDLLDTWRREPNQDSLNRFLDYMKNELLDHMLKEDIKLTQYMDG